MVILHYGYNNFVALILMFNFLRICLQILKSKGYNLIYRADGTSWFQENIPNYVWYIKHDIP